MVGAHYSNRRARNFAISDEMLRYPDHQLFLNWITWCVGDWGPRRWRDPPQGDLSYFLLLPYMSSSPPANRRVPGDECLAALSLWTRI